MIAGFPTLQRRWRVRLCHIPPYTLTSDAPFERLCHIPPYTLTSDAHFERDWLFAGCEHLHAVPSTMFPRSFLHRTARAVACYVKTKSACKRLGGSSTTSLLTVATPLTMGQTPCTEVSIKLSKARLR